MGGFTLEMLSEQCGVSMPNLRAWQRYGLLKPTRTTDGERRFDYSHLLRIELIVQWLDRGVPPEEIGQLLKGKDASLTDQWELCQERVLTALEKPQSEKLRTLLRKLGRDMPPTMLLDRVLLPLRQRLRAGNEPFRMTRRVRFDTQLVEYVTFVLQTLRKRAAPDLVMIPLNMHDPLDIWLQALRFSSEGFRIEVLSQTIPHPDPGLFSCDHYLLWSDTPLSPLQRKVLQQWRKDGVPLFTAGPGFEETRSDRN